MIFTNMNIDGLMKLYQTFVIKLTLTNFGQKVLKKSLGLGAVIFLIYVIAMMSTNCAKEYIHQTAVDVCLASC